MAYSNFKTAPPWRTGYALPGYIAKHSPIVYPNRSPSMFPMGQATGASAPSWLYPAVVVGVGTIAFLLLR